MKSASEASTIAAVRVHVDRLSYRAYVAVAAALAFAVTIYFFFPNVSDWRTLYLPAAAEVAETTRAADVLRQLENPWVRIANPTNRVIQWRLFFPLLGHYLGLPHAVFLALPHVGCLAALAMIVHVLHRHLKDRLAAFYAAVLAAGCAWFFVSTSWLSYNDSWIVLGLTVVAFARSPVALLAASLCCPWIDERFVLMLPVCLGVRFFVDEPPPRPAAIFKQTAICLLGIAPYLLIRAAAYAQGSEAVAAAYVGRMAKDWPTVWQAVDGSWAGLRCLWLYAGAFCLLAWRARSLPWNLAFFAGAGLIFVVSLLIAADLGRSISCFLPLGLAGIVLLHRYAPQSCLRSLPWVMIINLLLPAWHVVTTFRAPIYYVQVELSRLLQTPEYITADYYNGKGLAHLQNDQLDEAIVNFEAALHLEPNQAAARFNKASALVRQGRYQQALKDATLVIQQGVNLPDAHFLRGICHEALGNPPAAEADYQAALRLAPPNWPARDQASQRLESLQKQ